MKVIDSQTIEERELPYIYVEQPKTIPMGPLNLSNSLAVIEDPLTLAENDQATEELHIQKFMSECTNAKISRRRMLILAGGLTAGAVIGLRGLTKETGIVDVIPQISSNNLTIEQTTNRGMTISKPPFRNHSMGQLLERAFRMANGSQQEYQIAQNSLKEQPEETAIEIDYMLQQVEQFDYSARWMLTYIAVKVEHLAMLPLLSRIVLSPIPPEYSLDIHSFSSVREETVIRTTALEGIEVLAVRGETVALQACFDALIQPSLSIRRAAVLAILASPGGQYLRSRIASFLPIEQHFLLNLKRVNVLKMSHSDYL
jgi:hypothetical protein